jgi:hypothetical protein
MTQDLAVLYAGGTSKLSDFDGNDLPSRLASFAADQLMTVVLMIIATAGDE